ncbi:TBC domain-containing protein kinase-like protein [Cephus cinctus]|uniref:TBC domain-containing protein kinase-like protein n=1 Tax=Cephus cinctus TaxID=211228 RepID=A0AAJ7FS69_CEPCN|nr:TBC domain-containing protein kinase-like protein [Cephus cinctus]XP_015605687.1 TBC domain-containing protein kinase-like protein [Cephus cinctus]XP_015605688.1 TBC domain-containing protein kinase-like protein [Cephus cinctus]XP_015605689.1 TBC domain-containing protein kinase-like protein [Cephus cinctus]
MCPTLLENEDRCLGGMTFFAQSHPIELCGSNGLPLTPNSITIYGRSQFLKTINHPNLSTYLDIIRSKHERTIVVAEYSGESLTNKKNLSLDSIVKIAYQSLLALQHMNDVGLVHRHLSPDNILITKEGNVQLYNYGLYYMTNGGKNVSFPIGYPKYTAPEVFLGTKVSGIKVDSWSLGIIIAECLLNQPIWPGVKLAQCLRKVLSLLHSETMIFERLARENNCYDTYQAVPQELRDLVDSCLQIYPSKRKTPAELLQLPPFAELLKKDAKEREENLYKNVIVRKMDELYYLWQLAGGDITMELKKQGMVRSRPPILSIPNLIILIGQMFGRRDTAGLLDLRVVKVPLDTLRQRLSHIPYTANYPRLTSQMHVQAQDDLTDAASQLPLIIRERDTEYQFYRIVLYDRLLQIYPITREAIIREAHKDIPPPVRGAVWAALLGIKGDIQKRYDMIDKETPTHTDRQIEVDIPRCHQYSELLSSGAGHERLQRLLKAWVRDNPYYVYWQGLDSLTAPFLYLNFNDEARAFACLSAFIPKYLHKFFLKDNSAVIQEYLSKFSQIIAFHDPQLANHLKSISFVPELFAIPWFLTMFSHVFPLHKILHLWDKLLLGDSSFPLLVGLAILKQLRDSLLTSDFNECILLFSDLPEVDIELCVKDSMAMYQKTPGSITYRRHQFDQSKAMHWTEPEPGTERMPRISIDDLLNLLENTPDQVIIVDIRNNIQFERGAVRGSINIPFTSVQLSQTDINTLGPHAQPLADNKDSIVVIIGPHDQNNALFADFLVSCGVMGVCSLQGGIYALRSKAARILVPTR